MKTNKILILAILSLLTTNAYSAFKTRINCNLQVAGEPTLYDGFVSYYRDINLYFESIDQNTSASLFIDRTRVLGEAGLISEESLTYDAHGRQVFKGTESIVASSAFVSDSLMVIEVKNSDDGNVLTLHLVGDKVMSVYKDSVSWSSCRML